MALLVLAALALILNGPGGRWIVDKVITDQLAKQGLTGSLEVQGRLLTGLSLHDVHFSGGPTINEVHASKLALEYWLPDLLDKKLHRVEADGIRVVMTAADKPQEESEPLDLDGIRDAIQSARDLVLPVDLALTKVDFTLRRPDQDPLSVTLAALRHEGGTRYDLTGLESNALGPEGLRRQDFHLDWKPESLTLSRVALLPKVVVEHLVLQLPETGSLSLETALLAVGSRFDLTADQDGNLTAALSKGALDLAALMKPIAPDLDLAGTVNTLNLTGSNLLAPFTHPEQTWDAKLELDATGLSWPNGTLDAIAATLVIDDDTRLDASLGSALTLRANVPHPATGRSDFAAWLKNLPITVELAAPDLPAALARVLPAAGQKVPEDIPAGSLAVNGTITLDDAFQPAVADLAWSFGAIKFRGKPIPSLAGKISLREGTARVIAGLDPEEAERSLVLDASYTLADGVYSASVRADLDDTRWIADLIPSDGPDWKPRGPLSLEWSGSGSLPDATHAGKAELRQLTVTAPGDALTAVKFTGDYDWPQRVTLGSLDIRNGELWVEGSTEWTDSRLHIRTLRLHDQTGPLTSLDGSLPLDLKVLDPDGYLAQTTPITLNFTARTLTLSRLQRLVPFKLEAVTDATLDGEVKITGTPASPGLSGTLKASAVRIPKPEGLPALAAELDFRTENKQLIANAVISEEAGKLVTLGATIPFDPRSIADDPDAFLDSKLTADATVAELPLTRLAIFSEAFKNAEGSIRANLAATGPLRKPALTGQAVLDVRRYPLPDTPYRQIRDSKLTINFTPERVTIAPSTIKIAGGTLELSGNVERNGDEPVLDIKLTADHALLWRNDTFSFRADSELALAGPWSAARLTGSITLVDSLFYKDIEILPTGVPTVSAPKPQLPPGKPNKKLGIPALEPISNWTVDIAVRTPTNPRPLPVLIKGNRATGTVTVDARINGDLGDLRPGGRIEIKKAEAALPFSTLKINSGAIVLRPDHPLDPVLDISGTSSVQSYLINIFVYGPLSDPKYSLSSNPPLRENEILTLLASGTTASDLENQETATMKAYQLLLDEFRKRAAKPGGNAAFKQLVEGLDNVDLNVGENDPFSGRKFSSATLDLSDKWHLSAGVDQEGNTRGLVIFSMRFK